MSELLTDHGLREIPATVLVVCAHPDDVDFGAAGTVAALTSGGANVSYCLVSSGQAGSDHLSIDADELATLRIAEQTAAAEVVGVDDLTFLGFPDGALVPSIELRAAITAVIRRVKPDLVITQSPERNLDRIFGSHPDHLAAGEATLCAVYPDSRNPRSYPEQLADGLQPHAVPEVWLMAHPQADLRVDVTDTFDKKLGALRAHESQTGHNEGLEDMLRNWLTLGAEAAGFPAGRLAESFRVVKTA